MEKLKTFFWFHKDAHHLSDALLAIMITTNGPEFMKMKDENKLFDKRNHTVKAIHKNINYSHSSEKFNLILKFLEKIYKYGYTVSKYMYIREERSDIMEAVRLIKYQWIKYLRKKNFLEISMDFEEMRLD